MLQLPSIQSSLGHSTLLIPHHFRAVTTKLNLNLAFVKNITRNCLPVWLSQAFCFNITWSLRRGKILPKLEFFPWVLSFILEFCFCTEVFCKNYSKILKIGDFCIQNSWSLKDLLIKIAKPVLPPWKEIKIEFFSWVIYIFGKCLPELEFFSWVFGLSSVLEF